MVIYYCHEKFGGRNSAAMFDKPEERINEFMESNEGAKTSYQLYNKDQNSALILGEEKKVRNDLKRAKTI